MPRGRGTFLFKPQSPWSPVAAAAATLAIVAAAPLVAYVAARGYAWIAGLGQPGGFAPGVIEARLVTHEAVYVAVLNLTMIGLTLLAARRYGASAARVLALGPPPDGMRAYLAGMLIAAAATALWFGVLLTGWSDAVLEDIRPYTDLMQRERSWLMPPILCLLAPVAEELLFRGFLLSALAKSRLGLAGAALVTSAAWTALHVNRTSLALVQIFLSGLLLSALLARTGSLRIPILCHVLFNLGVSFVVIVLGLPDPQ